MIATRWRYRVRFIEGGDLNEEALNALGDEGWELCGVQDWIANRLEDGRFRHVHGVRAVLKRPARDEASTSPPSPPP
jgi:hypothetical protein